MRENEIESPSWFGRFISGLEVVGLNAARLILSVAVTGAVLFVILCLLGLVGEAIRYERATNSLKYQIGSISYVPKFSNILLSGRPQADADNVVVENRVLAAAKTRSWRRFSPRAAADGTRRGRRPIGT